MATTSSWTVVFEDKLVINRSGDQIGYKINDDAFWNDAKFSNIWAIQYGTTPSSDEVEYNDSTPHSAYDSSVLGNFNEFITRWDSAHLARLQAEWDANNEDGETAELKINRLGARPTSYHSPSV